jgi:hypothetical protein
MVSFLSDVQRLSVVITSPDVGLHTHGAGDDSSVDQRLALPPKQGGMRNTGFGFAI